jgi:23S rRNA (uridine2552-2'-O)-methyltransferase
MGRERTPLAGHRSRAGVCGLAKRSTSRRWLAEHHSDEFVIRARELGYRSRAVFKLEELDQRYALLKPGITVIDLGSAPGGWSQFASKRVGPGGRIIALDILPMEALPGVVFIEGDFREDDALTRLQSELAGRCVDLVLSDMAPNMSGIRGVDVPRALDLVELALELALQVLRPEGKMVVKAFCGSGFDEFLRGVRAHFARVVLSKPKASRGRSPETYVVASGYRSSAG